MSKKKNEVNVGVECTPDHQTRHLYHGTITFMDPKRSIHAPFTFTALMTRGDLHFEFFRRGAPLFQFHQDLPIEGQLTDDETERTFRTALIKIALEGVEGSGRMAEQFYGKTAPSDDDAYTQLASLITYSTECKLNLFGGMSEDVREYILSRLREAS